MRVAIVCQTEKKHHRDRFGNGIQAVERMQARLLADQGIHVTFIVPTDSERVFDDIDVVQLGGVSEEALPAISKVAKGKLNRSRSGEIEAFILSTGFSLVINHSFSSSLIKMCARLTQAGTPACTFIHCNPEDAFDIGVFAKINAYHDLTCAGGAVVCVSQFQRSRWRNAVKKRLGKVDAIAHITPDDVDRIFDQICETTAVSQEPVTVLPADDHFIMLGRPDPDKNIHKLLNGLSKLVHQPRVKIYMAFKGELEDHEYFRDRCLPYMSTLPNVQLCCNRPRSELIDDLRRARAIFIPALSETSSVAAIEALSYGVGAIAFCRDRDGTLEHALFEVIGEPHFIPVSVKTGSFHEQFARAVNDPRFGDLSFRNSCRSVAETKHSDTARANELLALLNRYSRSVISRRAKVLEF